MSNRIAFFPQQFAGDSGPACLQMLAQYYGQHFPLRLLRERMQQEADSSELMSLCVTAESLGLRSMLSRMPFETDGVESNLRKAPFPCIVSLDNEHFVVVSKIDKKYVYLVDPVLGHRRMPVVEFLEAWQREDQTGWVVVLEATPEFYADDGMPIQKTGFSYLFQFLRPYRKLLLQLLAGILLGSLIQLCFPFLTQWMVDIGIENQNIRFIYLILLAQLMLFASQMTVNLVQSWILLHMSTRINVSLIADFLAKLLRLPISFFDAGKTGDLLQRIADQRRIESFLTSSITTMLFAITNFAVFGLVLLYYQLNIFLVFFFFGSLYIGWVLLFLKRREQVDNQRFKELADNQNAVLEIIQGMQETKLQNSEAKRRWHWTHVQARLFRSNIRAMSIMQWQDGGAGFINQLKDILISFLAAKGVIDGEMTLGMMLAVQYIAGQLNGPLQQLIVLIRQGQDAGISLSRLGQIHAVPNEEQVERPQLDIFTGSSDIDVKNVSFRYNPESDYVLKNINLHIPAGKITAIVGTSGSGKTTLIKLLLGFFEPSAGSIRVGASTLSGIRKRIWRRRCGAVMQDGYIFSDTIANNIAESDETVNVSKLALSTEVANIQDFIHELPLKYNTMIGAQGNGVSQGQRQRLLIARAVYKNPDFLFFDEATNALDARNEKIIVENLNTFFEGKTVIVVAHRLSTVKNADQIVVLHNGELVEQGTHAELTEKKGAYYKLVKNQLELGA